MDSAPFTRLPPVAELVEPELSANAGEVPLVQRYSTAALPVTVVVAVGSTVMLTVEVPALNLQLPATVAFTVMVWLSAAKAAPPMSIAAVAQAAAISFLLVFICVPFFL